MMQTVQTLAAEASRLRMILIRLVIDVQGNMLVLDLKASKMIRLTVILIMLVMRAQANTLAIKPRIRLCISHRLGLQMMYQAMNMLAGPQVDSTGTTHAGTVFLVFNG